MVYKNREVVKRLKNYYDLDFNSLEKLIIFMKYFP